MSSWHQCWFPTHAALAGVFHIGYPPERVLELASTKHGRLQDYYIVTFPKGLDGKPKFERVKVSWSSAAMPGLAQACSLGHCLVGVRWQQPWCRASATNWQCQVGQQVPLLSQAVITALPAATHGHRLGRRGGGQKLVAAASKRQKKCSEKFAANNIAAVVTSLRPSPPPQTCRHLFALRL